ncbi:hypothetical protein E1262_05170 [Jiangella aurantiaca]|uniref:Uncharacterized protein n=1 Tax=Jiangella aurantiaca TaxID=2530373 RepID=A0A4R5AJA1_9ACTN|nr:hypothetical protein [Jiangella aurantiaca]TDD71546.1 hypothetical protein E1262_05170 [Jiangella aurantiaca]
MQTPDPEGGVDTVERERSGPGEHTAVRGLGDGRAVVYDDTGRPRAREGDTVGLGGGNLDYDNALMPIDPSHPCALGEYRYFFASGEMDPEVLP